MVKLSAMQKCKGPLDNFYMVSTLVFFNDILQGESLKSEKNKYRHRMMCIIILLNPSTLVRIMRKILWELLVQVGNLNLPSMTLFGIWHFFIILNLKILPIWFSHVLRWHLKAFHSRIYKQGLLFAICDFSIFKI